MNEVQVEPVATDRAGTHLRLLSRVGALLPLVVAEARTRIERFRGSAYIARVSRLPRIGRLSGIGLVLLAASAALWFSTLSLLRQDVVELRADVSRLEAAARSGSGVRTSPAGQASAFIKKFPTRTQLPAVLAAVASQATAAGLQLERGDYQFTPAKSGRIARYRLTLPVRGTYPQVRRFVDSTLVALPAVALESLKLEREGIGDEQLEADLQFAVMVRSE